MVITVQREKLREVGSFHLNSSWEVREYGRERGQESMCACVHDKGEREKNTLHEQVRECVPSANLFDRQDGCRNTIA